MKVCIFKFLIFETQVKDLAIWKTIIAMYSTILIATAINKFTFWINLQRCDNFFLHITIIVLFPAVQLTLLVLSHLKNNNQLD